MSDIPNECNECGKLVSVESLLDGTAYMRVIQQETPWSKKKIKVLCEQCAKEVEDE